MGDMFLFTAGLVKYFLCRAFVSIGVDTGGNIFELVLDVDYDWGAKDGYIRSRASVMFSLTLRVADFEWSGICGC